MTELLKSIFEWSTQPTVFGVLLGLSLLSLLVSLVGVPWYVLRLPADYFAPDQAALASTREESAWRTALVVVKNTIGALLVLAGIAMLVLPGQGIATILVGLLMMDFPQKKKLQRRVVGIRPVLKSVNSLRVRTGHLPLVVQLDPELDPPHSQPAR